MDKRRTILFILLSVVAATGWMYWAASLKEKYQVDQPKPLEPSPATVASTSPSTEPTTGPSIGPATNPTTTATTNPVATGALTVRPAPAGTALPGSLGSGMLDDPTYAMKVELSPEGAGIDRVVLNSFRKGDDFKLPLKERGLYEFQKPYAGQAALSRPLATAEVILDGRHVPLSAVAWSLKSTGEGLRTVKAKNLPDEQIKGHQVTYVATISEGGVDKVELTKTYTLFPRTSVTKGYEVAIDYGVKNLLGDRAVKVQLVINGPTLPPRESARSPDRQLMAGYVDAAKQDAISFQPTPLDKLKAEQPTLDMTKDSDGRPVAWAGTSSIYFDAFVLFEERTQIANVTARGEGFETIPDAENRPAYLTIETTPKLIDPKGSYAVPMMAHFGPRWREVLSTPHYEASTRQYDSTLIVTSWPCAICTFGWLITGLVKLLNGFQWLAGGFAGAGDWGLAIILLVALVRALLHPITKMSQVQMMKMAKMGPELQKLKEKHGEDKEAYTKAQVALMKEQGMAPILGCLPMFLQMPIWIALWQALQSTFELRQASFLWGWTWIKDLSRPDYLIQFDREIPLFFGMHIAGINLLPLLMAVIFFVQATIQNKLQPKGTPEQETQKKIMKWMSTVLFPLFLYNGPSGLNLYILTSTLVGIIESKRIRDHIKEREAAAKLVAPVVVDARPTRSARRAGRDKPEIEPAKPRGGIMGFLQRLQERAEEMKREQERKGGSGGRGKK